MRLQLAFEMILAGETRGDRTLGQPAHGLAHDGRSGVGYGLHAGGEIYSVPKNREVGVVAALNLSNYRQSGVHADAQLRAQAVFGFEIVADGLQPVEYSQRRAAGAHRPILERDRGAENREYAVAREPAYGPAVLADGLFHQPGETLHEGECRVLPGSLRVGGKAHHIGEENGYLPAFRFHASLPTGNYIGK